MLVSESHPIRSQEEKAAILAFGLSLKAAHDVWFDKVSRATARHGLSLSEFDVLSTLERSPDFSLTPGQIQASVLITSGGLTKIFRQLEVRGLIRRSRESDDRRVKPVSLSQAGLSSVRAAREEIFRVLGAWLDDSMLAQDLEGGFRILSKMTTRDPLPYFPHGI